MWALKVFLPAVWADCRHLGVLQGYLRTIIGKHAVAE